MYTNGNWSLLNPQVSDVTASQVQQFAFNFGSDSGVVDAAVVNLTPNNPSFAPNSGTIVAFNPTAINLTTTPTLNVNGMGALTITLLNNTPVAAGDFASVVYVIYNGAFTTWQLLNPQVSGAGISAQQVQRAAFNIGTDTGAADAYVVDLSPTVTSLTNGLIVGFVAANSNATTTPTLQVNALSPIEIGNLYGNQLYANDIIAGNYSFAVYVSSLGEFCLINPYTSGVQLGPIQTGGYLGASDTGAVNAYAMTLAPAPPTIPNAGVIISTVGLGLGLV